MQFARREGTRGFGNGWGDPVENTLSLNVDGKAVKGNNRKAKGSGMSGLFSY